MFNWFKKAFGYDELQEEIESLHLDNDELRDQVDELSGIANARKTLRCEAIKCMDFVDYSCSLKEISIGYNGLCSDFCDSADSDKELKEAINPSILK